MNTAIRSFVKSKTTLIEETTKKKKKKPYNSINNKSKQSCINYQLNDENERLPSSA
jgi:hypothetical protein